MDVYTPPPCPVKQNKKVNLLSHFSPFCLRKKEKNDFDPLIPSRRWLPSIRTGMALILKERDSQNMIAIIPSFLSLCVGKKKKTKTKECGMISHHDDDPSVNAHSAWIYKHNRSLWPCLCVIPFLSVARGAAFVSSIIVD